MLIFHVLGRCCNQDVVVYPHSLLGCRRQTQRNERPLTCPVMERIKSRRLQGSRVYIGATSFCSFNKVPTLATLYRLCAPLGPALSTGIVVFNCRQVCSPWGISPLQPSLCPQRGSPPCHPQARENLSKVQCNEMCEWSSPLCRLSKHRNKGMKLSCTGHVLELPGSMSCQSRDG